MTKKRVLVLGGGTVSHVRNHLALCAPAYGTTAKELAGISRGWFSNMEVELHLTKMAGGDSLETVEDVSKFVGGLIVDNTVKVVFFNVAMVDFCGVIPGGEAGKYSERLSSRKGEQQMTMYPYAKTISKIRKERKDIFLVGFKTTCGATEAEQFAAGLNLMKESSCNLVLANDTVTRNNMVITPEEGCYFNGYSRLVCLDNLVAMAYYRTHLSFTRSTVLEGAPVPWGDARVWAALREVVNYCVEAGAYKKFRGVTTGHFAAKIGENRFLTSIRKTNFMDISNNGMVEVVTDGPDNVLSYGAKPSVGGQSQRIIFDKYKDLDCIVHFHCPLKDGVDDVPVVSQREYECGSHECGENTAQGLQEVVPGIYCVMLNKHGPNIVFNHSIDPATVVEFIKTRFDLEKSTSGFEQIYLDARK